MNDQPNTDELTRRRIATVLVKAGIPNDPSAVNDWLALFERAHFRPECIAEGIKKLLEKCFSEKINARYAKDAVEVFFSMLPRRQSQKNIAAIEQMEKNIRKEQIEIHRRVISDPVMRKDYIANCRRMKIKPRLEDGAEPDPTPPTEPPPDDPSPGPGPGMRSDADEGDTVEPSIYDAPPAPPLPPPPPPRTRAQRSDADDQDFLKPEAPDEQSDGTTASGPAAPVSPSSPPGITKSADVGLSAARHGPVLRPGPFDAAREFIAGLAGQALSPALEALKSQAERFIEEGKPDPANYAVMRMRMILNVAGEG
jgi:hypothetical protein